VQHIFSVTLSSAGNIAKYDGKTNPSVWLEDYCLTCSAGGANDDLFIT
jgi:hypothetical protein